ncbi:MAG TPA: histidine kinase [Solirubrobacteraceae bacterium]|nr:histidine kinase [Solirubrobacteraceae bacterium]
MKHARDELALRRLAERAQRLTRLSADHPLALDLVVCLTVAAVSVAGLAVQHRLTTLAVVFCAALCAALPLRRLHPVLCFAVIATIALAQWLLAAPQLADVCVLIALYCVTLDGSLLAASLAAAVVEAGAIMAAVRWSPYEPLKVWVGLSGLATAAGVLGVSVRWRRALLASLQEQAARLEFERDQEGRLGAAAERARIAREMHDIVAHNLSVMIALADGATYAMDISPERAAEATRRVASTGREALVEMRRLLGVLREESSAQPLEPQPSLGRLDELLARVHAAGIPVTMDLDGDPHALADGVQLTVFRVAQEALTNTLKHATRPTRAHLALRCRPGRVELEVTDTGEARAAPTSGGRGLHGMRERAASYGGKLEAGPGPRGGWRVRLLLDPDAQAAPR